MIIDMSEPIKELKNKKLLILGDFVWMLRRLNVFSYGVKNMNPFSPLLVFLLGKS